MYCRLLFVIVLYTLETVFMLGVCYKHCSLVVSLSHLRTNLHSSQTHDACAVPVIILQRKILPKSDNVESFTLTAKLKAVSENLSVLH